MCSGARIIAATIAGLLLCAPPPATAQAAAERSRIVTTGPWAFAHRYDQLQPIYPLREPPDAPLLAPTGWAAFATSDGRTMDFARPWRWPVDPSARTGGAEIGFGWREANWAAAFGDVQPDYVRRAGYPSGAGPKPLVGLSFTVRVP